MLPPEIVNYILHLLPPSTLKDVAFYVCREWRRLIESAKRSMTLRVLRTRHAWLQLRGLVGTAAPSVAQQLSVDLNRVAERWSSLHSLRISNARAVANRMEDDDRPTLRAHPWKHESLEQQEAREMRIALYTHVYEDCTDRFIEWLRFGKALHLQTSRILWPTHLITTCSSWTTSLRRLQLAYVVVPNLQWLQLFHGLEELSLTHLAQPYVTVADLRVQGMPWAPHLRGLHFQSMKGLTLEVLANLLAHLPVLERLTLYNTDLERNSPLWIELLRAETFKRPFASRIRHTALRHLNIDNSDHERFHSALDLPNVSSVTWFNAHTPSASRLQALVAQTLTSPWLSVTRVCLLYYAGSMDCWLPVLHAWYPNVTALAIETNADDIEIDDDDNNGIHMAFTTILRPIMGGQVWPHLRSVTFFTPLAQWKDMEWLIEKWLDETLAENPRGRARMATVKVTTLPGLVDTLTEWL